MATSEVADALEALLEQRLAEKKDPTASSSTAAGVDPEGGAETEKPLWGTTPSTASTSSTIPSSSAPSTALPHHHYTTPRHLFAGASASPSHRQSSAASDCGSDLARSLDDITVTSLEKIERLSAKTEGTIKLNIPNVSSLKSKQTSSFHSIAGLPWRLAAKTECSKRTQQLKYFSVYIDCNPESESTLWWCDAVVEFRLLCQNGDKHFSRCFTNKFDYNSNNWGFPSFIEWPELLAKDKGYIKQDRVAVEARITVNKTGGVQERPSIGFLTASELTDVALVINGVKLYVSRQYLSLYSPVFHSMFFGNFLEKSKKEIPVEDVILEEFVELLQVVYPSHKGVSADNVEYLLELGDKFQIQFVMDEAERYLMSTDDINVVTKLLWADQYQMARLQDSCIRTFKTIDDIKKLKACEEYKNISNDSKAAVLEKLFKFL